MLEQNRCSSEQKETDGIGFIVWLEGQFLRTHEHPVNMEEAKIFAQEILLEHLRHGSCASEIDLAERYVNEELGRLEWEFSARRNSEGKLEAECDICGQTISLPKSSTLRKAADWSVKHLCPERKEICDIESLREDFHVV